jgi:hypothetical protein
MAKVFRIASCGGYAGVPEPFDPPAGAVDPLSREDAPAGYPEPIVAVAAPLTLEQMQQTLLDHRAHRRDLAHARDASREQKIIDAFSPAPIGATGASFTQDALSRPVVPDPNLAPGPPCLNAAILIKRVLDDADRIAGKVLR